MPGDYSFTPYGPPLAEFLAETRVSSVLDVGCGNGANTRGLCRYTDDIIALEPDRAAAEQAAATMGGGTATTHVIAARVEDLELAREPFPLVLSACVIGHVADLPGFLRALRRWAGGRLLIADWHPLACWASPVGVIQHDYLSGCSPVAGEFHRTLAETTNALIEAGFNLRRLYEGPSRAASERYRAANSAGRGLPVAVVWDCV